MNINLNHDKAKFITTRSEQMDAYVNPPKKIPIFLKIGIWIAEKQLHKTILPARILAWFPKAAVGAGIMESLVAHKDGNISERLLKLVRMQVSFTASCPFCIDLNSAEYSELQITQEEIEALQERREFDSVISLSNREKLALMYAKALTSTPISIKLSLLNSMRDNFTEREIVIIVSTIAQVNFWTRLIQGIGVKPAGFSESCSILKLDEYNTLGNI
jgi:alkylhydroperoxidase family enzyme